MGQGVITFEALLIHASISRYTQESWLRGSQWKPNTLYIPTQDAVNWAEKHWLPLWRELVPAMEVRLLPQQAPVQTKFHSIKSTGPARKWRDLLDES